MFITCLSDNDWNISSERKQMLYPTIEFHLVHLSSLLLRLEL